MVDKLKCSNSSVQSQDGCAAINGNALPHLDDKIPPAEMSNLRGRFDGLPCHGHLRSREEAKPAGAEYQGSTSLTGRIFR